MNHLNKTSLAALVCAGLLLLGACGGGSAALVLPPQPDLLAGTYCWSQWSADDDGPVATAQWGTVDADGLGLITPDAIFQNEGGVVTGPLLQPPATYNLDDTGDLQIALGNDTFMGGLSSDGTVAALGSTSPGSLPGILTLGQTGDGYTDANLTGDYHLCAFFRYANNTAITWYGGKATFDGAGTCTGLESYFNSNGSTDFDQFGQFGTYSVTQDGQMTWTPPLPIGPWHGVVHAGGEMAILSGAGSNDAQAMIVLIREGAGLTDATFAGDYTTVALIGSSNNSANYGSYTGSANSDGFDTWSLGEGLLNQNGLIGPFGGIPNQTYSVKPGGTLKINNTQYLGAVSPTGRFAVFAGDTSDNTEPALWLLIR